MQLIAEGRFVAEPGNAPGPQTKPSASTRWTVEARGAPIEIRIESGDHGACADIEAQLSEIGLVVVAFDGHADGRGFSLARQLRRSGYRGELRASGSLIADQYAALLACGFDTVEIPSAIAERQPAAHWRLAKEPVGSPYQAGYRGEPSALENRHPGSPCTEGPASEPSVTPVGQPEPMWWAHW